MRQPSARLPRFKRADSSTIFAGIAPKGGCRLSGDAGAMAQSLVSDPISETTL